MTGAGPIPLHLAQGRLLVGWSRAGGGVINYAKQSQTKPIWRYWDARDWAMLGSGLRGWVAGEWEASVPNKPNFLISGLEMGVTRKGKANLARWMGFGMGHFSGVGLRAGVLAV